MRHQRFVSANVHAASAAPGSSTMPSADARRDFETVLANPPAQAPMTAAL